MVLQLESRDTREYIMARCGFMYENLFASLTEVQRRREYIRGCESLCYLFQP